MSEIRLDRVHNQYVLIAPERLHRPSLGHHHVKNLSSAKCPFCEGNEELTPDEVFAIRDNEPNSQSWKTRVIPNLYKAVQIELEDTSKRDGMFESIPGVGAHEILIDSPLHDSNLVDLGKEGIENWLRSMIIRIEDLSKDKRLIHLSIFKNYGQNAGSTQDHPHTQLLALPVMPQNELVFLERNMKYYRRHGRGIVEDVVYNEKIAKERLLYEIGEFIAYCPFASAFPFEVMIAPRRSIPSLNMCSRKEIGDLALIIKEVFGMLESQLGSFDYNLYFHLAPINYNFENEEYMKHIDRCYSFSVRITPRIFRLGGFEVSTGMAINSVVPEECAKLLRGD
ncbi:UDPglucose--hexose-1-phosphate uridylyltransferase [Epsilonproteobacteria bacterium SCGC AD-308-O04]|nr:UDPglucose--hexose-1-phosphate uridylyltransferase [Epsilonproteobacteria bacterium SCGC AD-308-O04]